MLLTLTRKKEFDIMAINFPRATLKKIIKFHYNKALSKNVDVMLCLECILFLQRLAKEANEEAGDGNAIERRHIETVLEKVLQEFQG
ncbi:14322_t:CDS:2 [Acaulospora morrowiae]|uniref:14322_t:CDS:1 n=1 Tax=Acaulospora morrowiae TaxID=94023 RepID=A0A9N9G7C9_9GLOM|nr:14322_t:CDS:2 [Acaulospora morrowiae]